MSRCRRQAGNKQAQTATWLANACWREILRSLAAIAFAHGTLSSSDKAVWISYFEGGPRKQELTDQFLTEVESTLRSACEQCLALGRKMGVFINVERSGAGKAGDSAASI